MWALPADRAFLLDLFGRHSFPHAAGTVDPRQSEIFALDEELVLLWANRPPASAQGEQLPDAIIVRSHQMRNFIAWITTVARGYRPFTAFIRIIDQESARLALELQEPTLGKFENAVAGLVIAEALTLAGPQRSVSALSFLPCESTFPTRSLAPSRSAAYETVGMILSSNRLD